MIAILQRVLQNDDRLVDVADDDVGSAVVVQVAKSRAAAHVLGLKKRTGLGGDILKANLPGLLSRFAQVPQQHRLLQQLGRGDRKANDMTVGDEEVQSAIEIVVDEVGAEADIVQAD